MSLSHSSPGLLIAFILLMHKILNIDPLLTEVPVNESDSD